MAAATIAHEYIADLHQELVSLQRDGDETRALVSESADLVLREMPELTHELRRLSVEWNAQELLDPRQAERTLRLLGARLREVEPRLRSVRNRQDGIARALRTRAEKARGE